jgi:cytochrome c-type biogenesis protein
VSDWPAAEFPLAAAGAFWLGILTSISPCLMATNVTAISFIARRVDKPKHVLISGAFYTIGQSLAFVLLAMLIVTSLVSIPVVSHWLQKYMFRFLGPLLIVVALFLLELLEIQFGKGRLKQWAQAHGQGGGFWAAALLGMVFAMSFCPTTAAWFFGSLIPLATAHESTIVLPLSFAIGVAVPVLVLSLAVALAASRVGTLFKRVSLAEGWARRGAGLVFLAVGLYFTLAYTLDVI